MRLLRRHYEYVPFSWIFGYTAFRLDGRDQFFKPLKPSLLKYLLSLPTGLRWNKRQALRFLADWLSMPLRVIAKKIGLRIFQK